MNVFYFIEIIDMSDEQFWIWVHRLAPLFVIFHNVLDMSNAAAKGEYNALLWEISRVLS
jgi:hypothetical protein